MHNIVSRRPCPRQAALFFAQRLAKSRARGAFWPWAIRRIYLGKPRETAGRKAMGTKALFLSFLGRRPRQPSR